MLNQILTNNLNALINIVHNSITTADDELLVFCLLGRRCTTLDIFALVLCAMETLLKLIDQAKSSLQIETRRALVLLRCCR